MEVRRYSAASLFVMNSFGISDSDTERISLAVGCKPGKDRAVRICQVVKGSCLVFPRIHGGPDDRLAAENLALVYRRTNGTFLIRGAAVCSLRKPPRTSLPSSDNSFMSFGPTPPADIKRSLSYAVRSCSLAARRLVPRTPTPLVRDGYLMNRKTQSGRVALFNLPSRPSLLARHDSRSSDR